MLSPHRSETGTRERSSLQISSANNFMRTEKSSLEKCKYVVHPKCPVGTHWKHVLPCLRLDYSEQMERSVAFTLTEEGKGKRESTGGAEISL